VAWCTFWGKDATFWWVLFYLSRNQPNLRIKDATAATNGMSRNMAAVRMISRPGEDGRIVIARGSVEQGA
jgi:hypothetical protein